MSSFQNSQHFGKQIMFLLAMTMILELTVKNIMYKCISHHLLEKLNILNKH